MKNILILLAVSAIWVPAQAADGGYPSRIVTIVVPVAAGGGTDTFARMIAQGMQKPSGQNFIIENRSGGGGTIGTGVVARAAPDGLRCCTPRPLSPTKTSFILRYRTMLSVIFGR